MTMLLLMQPRILLAFWATSAHCWVMLSFWSTSTPESFSTGLLATFLCPACVCACDGPDPCAPGLVEWTSWGSHRPTSPACPGLSPLISGKMNSAAGYHGFYYNLGFFQVRPSFFAWCFKLFHYQAAGLIPNCSYLVVAVIGIFCDSHTSWKTVPSMINFPQYYSC